MPTPQWGLTAAAVSAGGAVVTGATVVGLAIAGALDAATVGWCLALDVTAAAVAVTAAALGAGRSATAVHILRVEALRRLRDPAVPVAEMPVEPGPDVDDVPALSAALDALTLRLRLAEEQAQRHRTLAEQSSVGMFELLSGLTNAEEGARGQLSAELHDTVAQSLALARSRLADGDDREVLGLLGEAEDQVRALMARTRPPALRDGDLGTAIAELRSEMEHRYGLVVEVGWPDRAVPIPFATAVTVYRFFQEALLNVAKHAEVDEARTTLDVDGEWVVATVSDRGVGFDPAAVHSTGGRHVGLGLLRERVGLAGGSVAVRAPAGKGTQLTMRLPLAQRSGTWPRAADRARPLVSG